MNWINIETEEKLWEIDEISINEKVLILKFSPGSVINFVVRRLLEREWAEGEMRMKTFLINADSNRELSESISEKYSVGRESPQIIIIDNRKPVFSASQGKILYSEIRKFRN